jgi:hypothetical protein
MGPHSCTRLRSGAAESAEPGLPSCKKCQSIRNSSYSAGTVAYLLHSFVNHSQPLPCSKAYKNSPTAMPYPEYDLAGMARLCDREPARARHSIQTLSNDQSAEISTFPRQPQPVPPRPQMNLQSANTLRNDNHKAKHRSNCPCQPVTPNFQHC